MRLKFWGRSAPVPANDNATPPAAAGRRRSFMAGAVAGLFKAAAQGNDKLPTIPIPPDQLITLNHMALVARSRQQWQDNDYSRAFIRLIRQNVVGPKGVTMQAKVETARGKLDKDTNAALEADWEDWGRKGNCDVTGTMSWRQVQCLAVETAARDGEFIVRKVYGDAAGPHGFALQFIDPQRLPVWYNVDRLVGGSFIRHGIEFNGWGRPTAYHFTSTDTDALGYYSSDGRGFVRVPADEVIHEFIVEMVGQRRGLPWSTTSLFRLRNVNGFEDAAIQNARASASKMGFIEYADGFGPEADDEPVTIDAEPLSFHELPEGAKIAEWSPQFPTNETASFLKSQLRGAASGMGVPYNELANDLEGVNFSSIRQLTLDAREHYKEIQEWLIEALAQPVRDAHLAWRLLNSAVKVKNRPIPADRLAACRKVNWQPRRWQWIDPRADVDGALSSMRGGLSDPSDIIREQGRDPDAVFQGIAHTLESMKAAGIPEDFIKLFMQGQPVQPPKEPKPAKDNANDDA